MRSPDIFISGSKPSEPVSPQFVEKHPLIRKAYELVSGLVISHVENVGKIFEPQKMPGKK